MIKRHRLLVQVLNSNFLFYINLRGCFCFLQKWPLFSILSSHYRGGLAKLLFLLFPVVFGVKMRLESCFGCNSFSAYRAAPFLVVPDFNEFFPSFGTVQHSFSVTFLIISRPFFIEWVSFGGDFPESDDFSICRVFQLEVFFIEIFTAESRLCCKQPHRTCSFAS